MAVAGFSEQNNASRFGESGLNDSGNDGPGKAEDSFSKRVNPKWFVH